MLLAFLAAVALPARGDTREELVQAMRAQTVVDQPYSIDSEVTLELPMGKTARLAVRDNPFGLKEVLLSPRDGSLYCQQVWANGEINGGGKKLEEGYFFRMTAAAAGVCFEAEWKVEGDTVHIRFRAMTGVADIAQAKEKKRQGLIELERNKLATAQTSTLPRSERIAGFARLWSEVKYNFVGFDRVPEVDWDRVLDEYLPRVEQAEQTHLYYRTLQECLAKLKDGHTNVSLSWPSACPPLWVDCIEGKAIVTEIPAASDIVLMPAATKAEIEQAHLSAGEEVTQIDGRSVGQVLESDIFPFISACTDQERNEKAYRLLLCGDIDSRVTLQVKSCDGATRQLVLTRSIFFKKVNPQFEHRELPDGLHYVAMRSFDSESIAKQFEALCGELTNTRGLIIDIRQNGGGNSSIGDDIASRLIDAPVKGSKWKTRQYVPAYRAWGRPEKFYEGDPDTLSPASGATFRGPVVVLIDAGTMSAAEDFLVVLDAAKRVDLVGERTTGSTGQPLQVKLPGDTSARICTKRDTYPDGREFVGVGVIPDVEVHPTQAGIAAGRDPIFDKGVEVLRQKVERAGKS